MLTNTEFDLWADGYDKSVGLSDEQQTYPFAGYRQVLNKIYNEVLSGSGKVILDIGFGTATLTSKFYAQGYKIFGQDFSEKMCSLAQQKMPNAKLYQGDFTKGLVQELTAQKYDAIIATYSLHHLEDEDKVGFLQMLQSLLHVGGKIYIGDVAFQTSAELEACRLQAGEHWDQEERYFIYEQLKEALPKLTFEQCSDCAGVLCLEKER